MASIFLVGLLTALVIYIVYKYMFYRPKNFPPGPPRIPFFGSYLFLLMVNYNHLHKAVEKLCKYYKTDVIGFYVAEYPTIVTHTTESSKLSLNHRDFDGKPQLTLAKIRSPDEQIRGIFFTEGENWHEQRRFFLRHFRDYGFGRRFNELELEMRDGIAEFIDLLRYGPKYSYENKYMQNGNVHCPHIFHSVMFNGMTKVIFNERIPRSEQQIIFDAGELSYKFLTRTDDWGLIFSVVPEFGTLFPGFSRYTEVKHVSEQFYNLVKKMIDEQFESFDSNCERHFLDQYFNEMKKGNFDDNYLFNYKQLVLSCADFFLPSLSATAITMQFLIQRLYIQPNVLKRIQRDIDTVVGHGRLPELNDRANLPYLEATLREIMRLETLVPSGLPHRALNDSNFMGFDIPKGTIVFSSLYACHKDPDVWKDPHAFAPERFLDSNGQLLVQKDYSLPFGAGKRLCAGETFARNSLFLVAAALFQNFLFEMPHGHTMPDPVETLTGTPRHPPKFWIKFVPR